MKAILKLKYKLTRKEYNIQPYILGGVVPPKPSISCLPKEAPTVLYPISDPNRHQLVYPLFQTQRGTDCSIPYFRPKEALAVLYPYFRPQRGTDCSIPYVRPKETTDCSIPYFSDAKALTVLYPISEPRGTDCSIPYFRPKETLTVLYPISDPKRHWLFYTLFQTTRETFLYPISDQSAQNNTQFQASCQITTSWPTKTLQFQHGVCFSFSNNLVFYSEICELVTNHDINIRGNYNYG